MKARSIVFWAALAAVLGVVALATAPRREDGPPLDPRSTGDLGTRALVLLLRDLGARVDLADTVPGAAHETALLLADDLDDARAREVRSWVRAGGTLVVADPRSELIPSVPERAARPGLFDTTADDLLSRDCDLPALRDVARVDPSGGVLFPPAPGAVGCFRRGDASFLVSVPLGGGTIVALGGPGALVNHVIGRADNAVLAAALLAPRAGTTVAFLRPPPPGGGRRTLVDLVSARVKGGLWQLVVAFGVLALWRSRRLGRPVAERQPVELAGSELVVAVGNLLQAAKRRDHAAELLRRDLRVHLTRGLALRPDAPPETIAAAASARTGLDEARLRAALGDDAVGDEAALVAYAQDVDVIRQEVTHAR